MAPVEQYQQDLHDYGSPYISQGGSDEYQKPESITHLEGVPK